MQRAIYHTFLKVTLKPKRKISARRVLKVINKANHTFFTRTEKSKQVPMLENWLFFLNLFFESKAISMKIFSKMITFLQGRLQIYTSKFYDQCSATPRSKRMTRVRVRCFPKKPFFTQTRVHRSSICSNDDYLKMRFEYK